MEEIIKFLHSFYGLPGYALAGIGCLVIGWVFKISEWFPNNRIPLLVVPSGALLNWILAAPRVPEQPLRLYVATNVVIGLAIGALSWLLHDQLLRQFEERIPFLGRMLKSGSTTQPVINEPPKL